MIICLLFLLVFFIFKDEQSQWKRFLACLSLAVAINIKLYPAIFLLVFVVDRRWRDLGVAIAMAALLFAVPLCYFKGIETLVELYHNLVSTTATMAGLGFGQKLNLSNTIAFTIAFLSGDPFAFVPSRLINLFLLGTTMIVCCILFFKRTVFSKSDFTWKLALLLASFIVLYPGFSYVYNLCFILPALALFLADRERMDRSTVVYLALFLLAILPIPFSEAAIAPWMDVAMASVSGGVTVYPMSLTCYVNSIAVAALWGITALSLCVQAFRNSPMRNRA